MTGPVAGTDLGEIRGEVHVPHPVEMVLGSPIGADRVGKLGGGDVVGVEIGDRVDGLGAGGLGSPCPAGDLDGLTGVAEADAGGWSGAGRVLFACPVPLLFTCPVHRGGGGRGSSFRHAADMTRAAPTLTCANTVPRVGFESD